MAKTKVEWIAVRYARHVVLGGNVSAKLRNKYPDRHFVFSAKLDGETWVEVPEGTANAERIYIMSRPVAKAPAGKGK